MGDAGFQVIAVAIDENTEAVRGLAEGITYPVLMDPDHTLTELYAFSNVPTVVWIDGDGRIARPNASEFGTDMFAEITGRTRAEHFDQLRAWVNADVVPTDADTEIADLSQAEIEARLHFKLAVDARNSGDDDAAARHFDRAIELAPYDFTISRAAMPLRGEDPFGERFMGMLQEWIDLGAPYHGIAPPRS